MRSLIEYISMHLRIGENNEQKSVVIIKNNNKEKNYDTLIYSK